MTFRRYSTRALAEISRSQTKCDVDFFFFSSSEEENILHSAHLALTFVTFDPRDEDNDGQRQMSAQPQIVDIGDRYRTVE